MRAILGALVLIAFFCSFSFHRGYLGLEVVRKEREEGEKKREKNHEQHIVFDKNLQLLGHIHQQNDFEQIESKEQIFLKQDR